MQFCSFKNLPAAGYHWRAELGLCGIWKLDIIAWLLGGQTSWAARTVYILVAAAAICLIPALCSPSKKEEA